MKLAELAAAIGAQLENGSPQTEITGVAAIENAAEGQVTFVANPKYGPAAKTTRASAVIVSQGFPAISTATLRTKNPYLAWTKAVGIFYQGPRYAPGIHPSAVIAANAKVGQNAHIGPYVVIEEGVEIGDDAVLLAHVVIYRGVKIGHKFFAHAHAMVRENCELGNSVLLQNGVVIGSDGFGFAKDENNHWHKIMQGGRVVIEDDVEIQANTCIDRASVGETRIGRGSKLDNMVHIGHSCTIGQDSLLCAQVGLAGTTEIGNKAILAGQVGVSGHVKIGDGAVVIAQSGVPQDVPAGAMVSGAPAIDHKLWLRCCAAYPKLPELAKLLRSKS